MPDFNLFEMDSDGDADGIDFPGFDQVVENLSHPNEEDRHRFHTIDGPSLSRGHIDT